MNNQNDILTTGTLYWVKSNHRGNVAVPLKYLSEEQKQILRSGLKTNKYQLFRSNSTFKAHYIWIDNVFGNELLVTDIELSRQIKNKINPIIKKQPNKLKYRLTLSDMKRLKYDFISGEINESMVQQILSKITWRPWESNEWKSKREDRRLL